MTKILFTLIGFIFLSGCSTTQKITTSKSIESYNAKSAYVVTHGGNSKDMDVHMQNALLSQKLKVSAGETEPQNINADLLVKYDDNWKWDISMYLYSINIIFYDKAGNLLATGNWQNSFMHTFPNEKEVVQGVVAEMVSKFSKTAGSLRKN